MRFLHECYWRLLKDNVLQRQRNIRKLPINKIKEIQWDRLQHLLRNVYANSEFYRSFFKSANLTPQGIKKPRDMLKLPTTDKQQYKLLFDKIPPAGTNTNTAPTATTSGSSGEPFKFYKNPEREGPNMFASYLLNQEAMGLNPYRRIKILEIKAKPRNEIDNLKSPSISKSKRFRSFFQSEIIGLSVHKINKDNLSDIVELIKTLNIKAIYSYSSALLTLSRLIDDQNISLGLNFIITIGEGLFEHHRNYISGVFNCPVYLDYSATEGAHMGSECKYQNGYHMDIYNYYFEFLKDNNPAMPGEEGDVVVTNLNNYAFPFIRYRIGDSALVTDSICNCGNNFPLVKEIYGRNTETLKTPTEKEVSAALISTIFRMYYAHIRQYQVIQTEWNKITVKIVPVNSLLQNVLNEVRNLFVQFTEQSMEIDIQLVKNIDAGKSGKKKTLITLAEYKSFAESSNL